MTRRSSYSMELMIVLFAVLVIGGYFLYSRQAGTTTPAAPVGTTWTPAQLAYRDRAVSAGNTAIDAFNLAMGTHYGIGG